MSTRTLYRRFREQTGTTPAQWVTRARVRRAQQLLETTGHAVERVASLVGFASATTLRVQFQQIVGTSPKAYRRAFRGSRRETGEPAGSSTSPDSPRTLLECMRSMPSAGTS